MQLDLTSWQAAPTIAGPRPTSADGTRPSRDYTAQWCAFVEARHDVAAWILDEARRRATGGKRISVASLFEDARAKFCTAINNSWRAPAADWLVTMDASLDAVIERRKRKAVGP
ncbi:MAG: hypothetical protein KBD62_37725 [Kofleriaceae bacterium]|nr:hypothetical protein [Kofleriaceae bacterium]